ncbi:MAG: MBL fold metallo-hydrolase [Archaeoglobaceae archaeon]|nr:MBL fold metallo-hydrolase [Archaeoglobaceae archaeon]MCX8152348.1 MBL fold metallo-hydrolase [Archaeoglobaceae archaeon]MDW8013624.1 MBL fold metallo-hydrolase [Archaeoglobaceae archaeon]
MEEVHEDIIRIKVPLPNNPLKEVNCYLIKDPPILIDTGMNLETCYSTLKPVVEKFGKPTVVATHMHVDHLGLAGRICELVLMSEKEIEVFKKFTKKEEWIKLIKFFVSNGFPENLALEILSLHPGIRYFYPPRELKIVDLVSSSGYELEPLLTPGHTPGHLCLYEKREGILFSGDHVLFDITPNIGYWENFDSLKSYVESLKGLKKLKVKIVYPGHREASSSLKDRIDELLEHHKKRLEEVFNAVKSRKTAWQIAQEVSWDVGYKSWEEFPVTQKWFAVSETLAHLEYLADSGEIRKIIEEKIYYCPC